jgi:predicted P-loop ATPase
MSIDPEEFLNNNLGAHTTWRDTLLLTEKLSPRALLANAIIAFRDAPEWSGLLSFDSFHQRSTIRGKLPWLESEIERAWTPADDIAAADWLHHQRIAVSVDTTTQAIEHVARLQLYHPVIAYLDRCRWDGEPRLDLWAVTYLGAEDSPYTRAVASRWMIAAVARVMQPGCKADCALILEGKQGSLKSTALRTLAAPWFTDEIAELGSKDAAIQLAGAWVVEMAELDAMKRSDVARIKSFLSRSIDRFRPPYGRRTVEQPRQCVFAGTVNDNEYLRDETGGRRFWPLRCNAVDIVALAASRDQLWAEARDRYLADESWWLDSAELTTSAAEEQETRRHRDPWESLILDYLLGKSSTSVNEILDEKLNIAAGDRTQLHANRVASSLKAAGWVRYNARSGLNREWRYRPG